MIHLLVGIVIGLLLTGCATSPTGQPQLQLFPEEQMAQMGQAAYQEVKQQPIATPVCRRLMLPREA